MFLAHKARIQATMGLCQYRAIQADNLLQIPELLIGGLLTSYPCSCSRLSREPIRSSMGLLLFLCLQIDSTRGCF